MSKNKSDLVVVSDMHIDKNWDLVNECVKDKTDSLNPNQELRGLVDNLNQDDDVLAVVFNGDSVDHHLGDYLNFIDFFKKIPFEKRYSNWKLLNKILFRLNKPYYEIPGNHDYRC